MKKILVTLWGPNNDRNLPAEWPKECRDVDDAKPEENQLLLEGCEAYSEYLREHQASYDAWVLENGSKKEAEGPLFTTDGLARLAILAHASGLRACTLNYPIAFDPGDGRAVSIDNQESLDALVVTALGKGC